MVYFCSYFSGRLGQKSPTKLTVHHKNQGVCSHLKLTKLTLHYKNPGICSHLELTKLTVHYKNPGVYSHLEFKDGGVYGLCSVTFEGGDDGLQHVLPHRHLLGTVVTGTLQTGGGQQMK